MRETITATPALAWSRTYPGRVDHVGEARRCLAGMLDDCPAAYDAVLCLSELAANAVMHSDSRKPGGLFTVRAGMLSPGAALVLHLDPQVVNAPDRGTDGEQPPGLAGVAVHHRVGSQL
jgi:hypothetical protein